MMSFDVGTARPPRIEIYGTHGTIAVPDPNRFSDPNRFCDPNRASADLAFHVLETMDAVWRAAHGHTAVELASTVERPEIVPFGAAPDTR